MGVTANTSSMIHEVFSIGARFVIVQINASAADGQS